jgi:hypothetical protein
MEITVTVVGNQCVTSYMRSELHMALNYIKGLVEQNISFTVEYK